MTIHQCAFKVKAVGKCLRAYGVLTDDGSLLANPNSPLTGAQQLRNLAFWGKSSTPSVCDVKEAKPACPSKTCNEKKGWFSWLFSRNKKEPAQRTLPDVRCCRRRYCRQLQHEPDPDLSHFGGQAYKTCGIGYVIQRDRVQPKVPCESREDRLLKRIETPESIQNRVIYDDPIPDSHNLYSRLVEMSNLKLHPLYKKISSTPIKEAPGACKHIKPYRPLTGPIDYSDLPAQIKINQSHLEKKNLYWCYKTTAPPRNFEGRIMEFKPKLRPTQWSKFDARSARRPSAVFNVDTCCKRLKRDTVFDSLKQKPMDFIGECPAEANKEKSEQFVYQQT